MRLRHARLFLMMLTMGLATAGCPSFHGREGIIHEAILKDIYQGARTGGCTLSTEDWRKYCYDAIVMATEDGMEVEFRPECPRECRSGQK